MGKKRKRNKQNTPSAPAGASTSAAQPSDDEDGDGDEEVPAPEEVETAIYVVRYLSKRPELFQHRAFKELRAALHPLVELQRQRYDPIDYTARASAALRVGKWSDALQALEGLRAYGCASGGVKQGTLQRWVRDCAAVPDGALRLRLLDAVLRVGQSAAAGGGSAAPAVAAPASEGEAEVETQAEAEAEVEAEAEAPGAALEAARRDGVRVTRHAAWSPPAEDEADGGEGAPARVGSEADLARRVVLFERGAERQPADHRDRSIYACAPGSVGLAPDGGARVQRHAVPHVRGAFVLTNVLSRAECAALVRLTEWLGFQADHPLDKPAPTPIATCEWAVDQAVLGPLFERCRPHLPPRVGAHELAGLNGHFRCFRYPDTPGAVYRPHIDGSWPRSGLNADGEYEQDAVLLHQPGAGGRSRLTFLVYLNDGFEGGATSFYLPAAGGGLEARGVQPRCGAVLVFPQGNTASLVHEGSEVTRGAKYVIRTDVLFREPAAAGRGPSG